jgi:hypothetical protein
LISVFEFRFTRHAGRLAAFPLFPVPASQELGVVCATGPACLRGVYWVYPRVLWHMYPIRRFTLFMLVFLALLLASISIVVYTYTSIYAFVLLCVLISVLFWFRYLYVHVAPAGAPA